LKASSATSWLPPGCSRGPCRAAVVDDPVAVLVFAVALLGRAVVDRGILGRAVGAVRLEVVLADVALAVGDWISRVLATFDARF
jgi:hypothetical protein